MGIWNGNLRRLSELKLTRLNIYWLVQELLTGKVPYASFHKYQVPSVISSGKLPQAPDFRGSADESVFLALWSIARKCWHDNPLERPSAADIRQDVKVVSLEARNEGMSHSVLASREMSLASEKKQLDDIFASLHSFDLTEYIRDKEDITSSYNGLYEVYRATSTKHNKTVVLKCYRVIHGDITFAKVCNFNDEFDCCLHRIGLL